MDRERIVAEEHKIIVPLSTLKLFGVMLWGLHFFARVTDRDFGEPFVHATSWFMVSNDILNVLFLCPLFAYGLSYRYFLEDAGRSANIRLGLGAIKGYPRFMLMGMMVTVFSWTLDKLDLYICFWSPQGFPMEGFLTTFPGAVLSGLVGPIIPIWASQYADCFGIMTLLLSTGWVSVAIAFIFRTVIKYDIKLAIIATLLTFGPMSYWWGWDLFMCNVGSLAGVVLAWHHTTNKPRLSRRQGLLLLGGSLLCLYFHWLWRAVNSLVGYYVDYHPVTRIYIYTVGVCGLLHLFMANEQAINSMNLPERFWVDKIGMPMYFFQVAIIHSYGCWFMDDFAVTDEDNFLRLVGLMTTFNVVLVFGIAIHYVEKPFIRVLNNRLFRRLQGDVGTCSHGHYPFHSECIEQ